MAALPPCVQFRQDLAVNEILRRDETPQSKPIFHRLKDTAIAEGFPSATIPPHSKSSLPLCGALLCLGAAIAAADANALTTPFVFDDQASITDNATIQHLSALTQVLRPPHGLGMTVEGRPVLNLSLAINYAISALRPWSYHVVNLLIHVAAAALLLGLLRRLSGSLVFAGSCALLWAVHPLNTEAVTYVIQRAESLMGLCYLGALYAFVRSRTVDAPSHAASDRRWQIMSVVCCAVGMATKEVMVSAPIVILLIDRWMTGSFPAAWRARRGYYLALGATWLVLAALALGAGNRGGTVAFGSGVAAGKYWLTQPAAILLYLRLSFWPDPLNFDYGTQWATSVHEVLLPLTVLLGLLIATFVGLRRNRWWGIAGAAFWMILAPTSLVPGVRQTAAEHRMYLPLAAVIVVSVFLAARHLARIKIPRWAQVVLAAATAVALAAATRERNFDYASEVTLYADAAAKSPDNAFAQANYGTALLLAGEPAAAQRYLEAALALNPRLAQTEDDLGTVQAQLGHVAEAEAHYGRAMEIAPQMAAPHVNAAELALRLGRAADAEHESTAAIERSPGSWRAYSVRGLARLQLGATGAALSDLHRAAALAPTSAEARINEGEGLLASGDSDAAYASFAAAQRLDPTTGAPEYHWARALAKARRFSEAVPHFQAAVRLAPASAAVHRDFAEVLLTQARTDEAVAEARSWVRLSPTDADAHRLLAAALAKAGRAAEAQREAAAAEALRPL